MSDDVLAQGMFANPVLNPAGMLHRPVTFSTLLVQAAVDMATKWLGHATTAGSSQGSCLGGRPWSSKWRWLALDTSKYCMK